jgi:hypothetical protein
VPGGLLKKIEPLMLLLLVAGAIDAYEGDEMLRRKNPNYFLPPIFPHPEQWHLYQGPNPRTDYAIGYSGPVVWSQPAFFEGNADLHLLPGPGHGRIAGQAIDLDAPDPLTVRYQVPENSGSLGLWFTTGEPNSSGAQMLNYHRDIFGGRPQDVPDVDTQSAQAAGQPWLGTSAGPRLHHNSPWAPFVHFAPEFAPPGFAPLPPVKHPQPGLIKSYAPIRSPLVYISVEPSAPKPDTGPALGAPPLGPPHVANRPGPGRKERKTKARGMKYIMAGAKFFGDLTEVGDTIQDAWYALPKEYRKYSYYDGHPVKPSKARMARQLYAHAGKIDLNRFWHNYAMSQIRDMQIGSLDKMLSKRLHSATGGRLKHRFQGAPYTDPFRLLKNQLYNSVFGSRP